MVMVSHSAGQTGESLTWSQRLGYPPDKRVLLLHADDLGMCYEANAAAKVLLPAGPMRSGSAMVPCPWFDELAVWANNIEDHDVGLHLTLTSEWRHYRWGPVAPAAEVPGLLDRDGYLWREVPLVVLNAKPAEVEREIRAQVERALDRGLKPTHLDTHMGTLYGHPEFTRAYFAVAVEYGIPAMVVEPTPKVMSKFQRQGYPVQNQGLRQLFADYPLPRIDGFDSVPKGKSYAEVKAGFLRLVSELEPGITQIIAHPAFDSEALRHITNSWQQRVWEAQLFGDREVAQALEGGGVLFTTWREIMQRWEQRQDAEGIKRR